MEREGKLYCGILTRIYIIMILTGCSSVIYMPEDRQDVHIIFEGSTMKSRSYDPDEDKVTDISLMIFDETGDAEECIWLADGEKECTAKLIMNKEYTFCACANFGRRIYADHIDELDEIRFHLAYPDEYRNGIPMMADTDYIEIPKDGVITLKFIRLMSKISIRIDRSRLSEDVSINIRGIRIGNCPKSVAVFSESRAKDSDDCFPLGFSKEDEECYPLNTMESKGLSYPISLYMLENMQGKFSDYPISNDSEKVFDTYDPRWETCSYIELDIDYLSPDKVSKDGYLKYRFFLGENRNDLSIERNCHYQITVTPEDDGLKEDSWRVDKSCITSTSWPR